MGSCVCKPLWWRQNKSQSAGTVPGREINPLAVQAMREKRIDISRNHSHAIDTNQLENADMIITMGYRVQDVFRAPLLKNAVDWGLEDPKGKPIEKVREIRDEVEKRVKLLLSEP